MNIGLYVKNKNNPYVKLVCDSMTKEMFGDVDQIFDGMPSPKIGIKEGVEENYDKFITMSGIPDDMPVGDLSKALEEIKNGLKEKFSIPQDEILFKFEL